MDARVDRVFRHGWRKKWGELGCWKLWIWKVLMFGGYMQEWLQKKKDLGGRRREKVDVVKGRQRRGPWRVGEDEGVACLVGLGVCRELAGNV